MTQRRIRCWRPGEIPVYDKEVLSNPFFFRGAEIIEDLRKKQIEHRQKHEQEVLYKIKKKMEKIRATQNKLRRITDKPTHFDGSYEFFLALVLFFGPLILFHNPTFLSFVRWKLKERVYVTFFVLFVKV